jgi:hypothetical protein
MSLALRLPAVPVLAGLVALALPSAAFAAKPLDKKDHAVTAPGAQADGPAHFGSCAGDLAAVFAPWHDNSLYISAPDGGLEAGGAGWSLAGGAHVVSGGDPFSLGGKRSTKALSLPAGSSTTSPSACIAKGMPTFRFTARNKGAAKSRLRVTIVYGAGGKKATKRAGDIAAGRTWSPAKQLSLRLGQVGSATSVSFRFSPLDSTGSWQIDSLYVDPRLSR